MFKDIRFLVAVPALCILGMGCGGSKNVLPLAGEPPEIEKMLKEQGQTHDLRPGSIRTVDRFFEAFAAGDGSLCWYLLDLRAAAAWQAEQSKTGEGDAGPANIVALLRERLSQTTRPSNLKRVKLSANRTAATVAVTWGESDAINLVVAMNQDGWRVVLAPKGAAIPDVQANPRSSQRAAPVDFDEIHKQDPSRDQGGGMNRGTGRF